MTATSTHFRYIQILQRMAIVAIAASILAIGTSGFYVLATGQLLAVAEAGSAAPTAAGRATRPQRLYLDRSCADQSQPTALACGYLDRSCAARAYQAAQTCSVLTLSGGA